ncbi:MAG: hypothetical protein M0D55_11980 [Elusimicrobiota bacterium]|nr:MAG: hypothetical protein M0D55_11980 [Elusimicrobiota bacterium]
MTAPDMYASSMLRAHEIKALEAVPAAFREKFLRRQLIAQETLPLQNADTDLPAKHRAAYGAKEDAARIARASCDWETLDPKVRAGLEKKGVEEKNWPSVPISMRASVIAAWWHDAIFAGSTAEPASPEYLVLLKRYSRAASPYLTDMEATELDARLSALEKASKVMAETPAGASVPAESRFVHDPRDPEQKKALAVIGKRLTEAFRRLAAGTSAEELMNKAAGAIQVGGVPAGSDGAYQAYGDKLALPADVIDYFLLMTDHRFEELFTDDQLMNGLAVLYMPTYVHETTHRLQGRIALKKSLTALEKGVLYGHEDEHEAYLAQELFVREFALKKPVLAEWARSIPRVAGMWDPKIVRRQHSRVSRLYADVPGGDARRAQGLMMAITESGQARKLKPRIERELARRRGHVNGRHEPVRLTEIEASSIGRAADRLLRRWRDIAREDAADFADLILAYLDEGDARIAALKERLRPLRRASR